jgi:hypothetical protein
MFTKLLLTLFVIVVAWLVISNRQRRMAMVASEPHRTRPAVKPAVSWRWGVYLFLILMVLGSALFLYLEWKDSYRVVSVQVIDTQSGKRAFYTARRMDVDERHFVTLDGREVSVADTERIELKSVDNQRP